LPPVDLEKPGFQGCPAWYIAKKKVEEGQDAQQDDNDG
jgi:hypothetical protein